MSTRQYDIVLWGATGYTGSWTAKHIARSYPTDIRWAIAGRSESKLKAVAESCAKINPDRVQPSIEICNLDEAELADLARKTTVLIATVGPFCVYGEPALKACAENGTHYLDITGEIPWVMSMVKKYEKVAKSTGAVLISQSAVESLPSDLVAYAIVKRIHQELSTTTREVIFSVEDIKSTFSGGTLHSILEVVDRFSIPDLRRIKKPFIHSPIPGPTAPTTQSAWTNILGVREHPDLGILTTYFGASSDVPIVERSWGLIGNGKVYGPNFRFSEYARARSIFLALFIHFVLTIGTILLKFPFATSAMRKVIPPRGYGASEEETKSHFVEYRAVGRPNADTLTRAHARVRYTGGLYEMSGLLVSQAALTLLKDDVTAKKLGGGFMTPATLGQPLIDRLADLGFKIEVKMVETE
ncbi:saccharopine dehydrogenase [Pseudogymnoascus sp. 05NY08]|nr:saccharopine dehydrogenase [Pseudogymnoascus sp. 05NY08]